MAALSAPVLAAALLVGIAGVAKLAAPSTTVSAIRAAGLPAHRVLVEGMGMVELVLAVAIVVWAPTVAVGVLAIFYLGFAAFTWRLRRRQGDAASCGCFGARTTPAHPLHVMVNLVIAAVAILAVVWPVDALGAAVGTTPLAGIPFIGATFAATGCLYLALTSLPDVLDAAQ